MKRAHLRVQTILLSRVAKRYGSKFDTFDLLQVRYLRSHPPEREYPIVLPQLDVFARFFVHAPGRALFKLNVIHVHNAHDTLVASFDHFIVDTPDEPCVIDHSFRLPGIPIPLPGSYRVELLQRKKPKWSTVEWLLLKSEFFWVEAEP